MSTAHCERVASTFVAACQDELEVPKPGNVHYFSSGHRMTARDFALSAEAAAGPLAGVGASVGSRILGAVEATLSAAGTNTNLGIILLCAPIAAAATGVPSNLRIALARVLGELDAVDASLAFRAIVRASPAGLGRSDRHDVFATPQGTLREAMAEAADRDRIARQYVTDFEDVFDLGLTRFTATVAATSDLRRATIVTYLTFLSTFPDTHIVRKYGPEIAERVRRQAFAWNTQFDEAAEWPLPLTSLIAWDAELKQADINPGTSADLTVATAFVYRLQSLLPRTHNSD